MVPSAYAAMAYKFNSDAGVIYKYGAPATKSGVQTLQERADVGTMSGIGSVYQLGREDSTNNMYVSIHAAAIGVPTSGQSVESSVAWLQNSATDRRTFQQRPQLLWQQRRLLPTSIDDYVAQSVLAKNDPADLPVSEHRGENAADSPATRLSLVATQGSPTKPAKMFTVGTLTAQNRASTSFKLGFVPTGIAVTGGGEFALVSGWDTPNTKGQVAVVSLGSAPQDWKPGQARYDWWHGWMDMMHPGFADQGNYVFMKVIGYVDLPSDMKAPTAIAATTGIHPYTSMLKYDAGRADLELPDAELADGEQPGEDAAGRRGLRALRQGRRRRRGLQEREAGGIHRPGPALQVHERHVPGQRRLQSGDAERRSGRQPVALPAGRQAAGDADGGEDRHAGQAPDRRVDHRHPQLLEQGRSGSGSPPTRSGRPMPQYARAAIAVEGGELQLFSLGRYAAGVKPTTPAPTDIQQVGTVTGVGDNITHLAAAKDYAGVADPINDLILFTDRANRRWGWVKLANTGDTASTGSVLRTMEDSRVDPIMVTMADNYSTKGNVLTVADYAGASIANYRFGDVVYPDPSSGFCTQAGACPTYTYLGEFAGKLALPFKPTSVHSSNVP